MPYAALRNMSLSAPDNARAGIHEPVSGLTALTCLQSTSRTPSRAMRSG